MDKYQTAMIIGLLIASVVILIGTAVYFCVSSKTKPSADFRATALPEICGGFLLHWWDERHPVPTFWEWPFQGDTFS